MKGFQLIIDGNWAHFKKPETNNNPLTHDFITKTALIGLIGAVSGIDRQKMKEVFPKLSDDLLYGVQLLNTVKKISWGFSSRTAFKPSIKGAPKYFEFLKNPRFLVSIALKNEESLEIFTNFKKAIKNEETVYTPVLGWHNCPANLKYESEGEFSEIRQGDFTCKCFVETPPIHNPQLTGTSGFRVGFEKIPTFQNNDFWNLPERYKAVIYPDAGYELKIDGSFYEYLSNEKWWLI